MSKQTAVEKTHGEVFELLPWYANQTLAAEHKELVSRHISECSVCQDELQFLGSLHDCVNVQATDAYFEHANVENSLADVLNRIDSEQQGHPTTDSWISRLKMNLREQSWLSFNLPATQWVATAMVGILVAGLGTMLFVESPRDDFTVLSSPDTQESALQLIVDMSVDEHRETVMSAISTELNQLDVEFIIEETSEREFLLAVDDSVSVSEVNELISTLESINGINKVSLSPLRQ
jgi:hypothetical protein